MNKNIALIIIDTLRDDFSDEIYEELKEFGFKKYSAIAPSFWTLPSHTSMFTGLYPSAHGIHESPNSNWKNIVFDDKLPNIINELKDKGYKTYWFSANMITTPSFGFPKTDYFYTPPHSRASELFRISKQEREYILLEVSDLRPKHKKIKKMLRDKKIKLMLKLAINKMYRNINQRKLNWPLDKGAKHILEKIRQLKFKEPFFVFMNLMEVHGPWRGLIFMDMKPKDKEITLPISIYTNTTKGEKEKFSRKFKDKYIEEIKYLKKTLKEIVRELDKKNALIVVTSDHGEVLGERDFFSHYRGPSKELIKVPLFIKYPSYVEESGKGVISLCKFPVFFREFSKGKLISDKVLYGEVVFSEAFGTIFVKTNPKTKKDKQLIKKFNQHRIVAVSEKGWLEYNKDTQEVENFEGDSEEKEKLLGFVEMF